MDNVNNRYGDRLQSTLLHIPSPYPRSTFNTLLLLSELHSRLKREEVPHTMPLQIHTLCCGARFSEEQVFIFLLCPDNAADNTSVSILQLRTHPYSSVDCNRPALTILRPWPSIRYTVATSANRTIATLSSKPPSTTHRADHQATVGP